MSEQRERYRFGPRERGGALAGWRAGQILTVALGLLVGVLVLRAQPNVAGVAMAIIVLVACGALATWPVSGRTGDQWLPVIVHWGARRAGGRGKMRLDALGALLKDGGVIVGTGPPWRARGRPSGACNG